MKLNPINLTVTDVPGTVKFPENYFGLQGQGGDHKFAVLFDDDGLVLTRYNLATCSGYAPLVEKWR